MWLSVSVIVDEKVAPAQSSSAILHCDLTRSLTVKRSDVSAVSAVCAACAVKHA